MSHNLLTQHTTDGGECRATSSFHSHSPSIQLAIILLRRRAAPLVVSLCPFSGFRSRDSSAEATDRRLDWGLLQMCGVLQFAFPPGCCAVVDGGEKGADPETRWWSNSLLLFTLFCSQECNAAPHGASPSASSINVVVVQLILSF